MEHQDWKQTENRKINKMNNFEAERTFISSKSKNEVAKDLVSESWQKKNESEFYKDRNNYIIKLYGKNHPIWEIAVESKSKSFSKEDWKLRQDFKSIKNLGKKLNKKLYINENNRSEIIQLINTLIANRYSLVYNENYIIFLNGDTLNIFKIAARMNLKSKSNGWYIGQKKIF